MRDIGFGCEEQLLLLLLSVLEGSTLCGELGGIEQEFWAVVAADTSEDVEEIATFGAVAMPIESWVAELAGCIGAGLVGSVCERIIS